MVGPKLTFESGPDCLPNSDLWPGPDLARLLPVEMDSATLKQTIATLLPNGLGARGDQEANPVLYPNRPLHVLLATSGSVASIKAPLIVAALRKVGLFSH